MPRKKRVPPRTRARSLPIDHDELANHICVSLTRDLDDRSQWMEQRVQRYAKMRGWREPKSFPWPDASNAHLPFLMTESLRTQDTIHNAVLSRHPVVEAMAVQQINSEKQANIDNLIDYQIFAEQQGEEIVATLIQQYCDDGVFMAYVPWIRYDESVNDVRIFEPIPPEESIASGVMKAVSSLFADFADIKQIDDDGFRWVVTVVEEGVARKVRVEAYTKQDGRLEVSLLKEVRAYDGPVIIPKSVDEWVVPWRSANPQPPSPSNPNGAEHVMLLVYPTLDEIKRLYADGYYDSLSEDELDGIEAEASEDPEQGDENAELKSVKDGFEGVHGGQGKERAEEASGGAKLTRVIVFMGWDVNEDDLEEQVVVHMIRETKTILRVRYLTEDYPSDPPLRPLASSGYLPVEGRMYAISLPELLESLHDLMKINFDQMVDAATIKNVPWFTYRPSSGLNPETIRIAPGEGVPMNDPKNDIHVPQFASQNEAFGMNMISLLTQFAEKASMQGDIQFGRVPKGKSSALRTASGMQSILAQGDARPERIMRRFFSGFKDIYRIIHELNQRFLPRNKQYRLVDPSPMGKQVYESVDDIERISGRMQFVFKAGMFNTDKETAQQVLQTLMGMLINPLLIQMGIVTQPQVTNLLTDFIKLVQREPSRYLAQPQPGPPTLNITAQEAVSIIINGRIPKGTKPQEGHEAHIKAIQEFMQQPDFDDLSPRMQGVFDVYINNLQQEMQQLQQQQQLLQAAAQFQQSVGGGGGGTPGPTSQAPPPNTGVSGNAQVNSGELLDESLQGG